MGGWEALGLAGQLCIVIGILIFITLVLGLIVLLFRKRRLARNGRHQELEDGGAFQLNERRNTERDRAIEKGLYPQSRPTTAGTVNILHGVTTNLSGTTLESSTMSTPPPKRLTLGFGSLSVSKFDYTTEPNSQDQNESPRSKASADTSSARGFQPGSRLSLLQDSKRQSTGSHTGPQTRFQSGCALTYDDPLTPSTVSSPGSSPIFNDFALTPAPANRSVASSFVENESTATALPAIPPRAARRKGPLSARADDNLERPPTRQGGGATDWSSLSIPSQTESYEQLARDKEQESSPDRHSPSPTRDSLASVYSLEDSIPNKLSSPSRQHFSELNPPPFLSKRQSTDAATIPPLSFNFAPINLPPTNHSRNPSSGSLKRAYDSLKVRHSRTSPPPSKSKGKTERQRDHDPKNHRRNRSRSMEGNLSLDYNCPRESPFSDTQALNTTVATTRSRSSSNARKRESNTNRSHSQPAQRIIDQSDATAILSSTSIPTISVGRFRSDSESSIGSISNLYSTYIEKSNGPAATTSSLSGAIGDGSGWSFDLHGRTEHEQMEYDRAEKERNGLLSASAAVEGVRKAKKLPPTLILDGGKSSRVPRAIESPVSGWRI